MKDEIKEILEELKEKNETYKECSENGIIENEYYKSHILLDYITNLQERIEKAIEYIKEIGKLNDAGNYQQFKDYKEYNELLNILQGSDKE